MAGKKVNLAEVFKKNEEPQKPELEAVEAPPEKKSISGAILMKPSTGR